MVPPRTSFVPAGPAVFGCKLLIRLAAYPRTTTKTTFRTQVQVACPSARRISILCTTPSPGAPVPSGNSSSTPQERSVLLHVSRTLNAFTLLFPVWTVLAAGVAIRWPSPFARISDRVVAGSLASLMLAMGLSIRPEDMHGAVRNLPALVISLVGCYVFMPALSIFLSGFFNLPKTYTAGLILLGLISGGQASNLSTHIAKGDTALSVALTTCSTMILPLILSLLSPPLLGTLVPIDAPALALYTLNLTLVPISIGLAIRASLPRLLAFLQPILPAVAILCLLIIIVGPVARMAPLLTTAALLSGVPAVFLLHLLGGIVGYATCKMVGLDSRVAKTVAFETGFKSPVLAFALATKHFPEAAIRVPSAISIVVLAPMAALAAVVWRLLEREKEVEAENVTR